MSFYVNFCCFIYRCACLCARVRVKRPQRKVQQILCRSFCCVPPNIIRLTRSLPFCSRHKFVNYTLCENSHMHERQCRSFTTSYKWPSTAIVFHLFLSLAVCAWVLVCVFMSVCPKWDQNTHKTLAINGNFRCKALNTAAILATC